MFVITKIYKRLRAEVDYRRAVRQADKVYNQTGIRQFVMAGVKGKLMILDRPSLKTLKKRGLVSKDIRMIDVQLNCFYATPDASGREKMMLDQIAGRKKLCIKFLMK